MAYVKILRVPNLILLALTMFAVRYCLVGGWLAQASYYYQTIETTYAINFSMADFYFNLLVLSSVLIAAAGFIINDYFDLKTDRINRPGSNAVGKGVSRRMAIFLHITLNAIGLLIGVFLAWKSHAWRLIGVQVFSILLLWVYSSYLKKRAGYGDIVISFLTLLVPISVYMYEAAFGFTNLIIELSAIIPQDELPQTARLGLIPWAIMGYAIVAALSNFIRQNFKDLEQLQGDRETHNRTLPLVWGEDNTRKLAIALTLITFALIALTQYIMFAWQLKTLLLYTIVGVQLPLAAILVVALRARQKNHYALLNRLMFVVMVMGVISLPVLYYNLTSM